MKSDEVLEAVELYGMFSSVNHLSKKELMQIFMKRMGKEKGKEYELCFHCNTLQLTIPYNIRKFGCMYDDNRYHQPQINAKVFELLQILLWSRLSRQTYRQLLNFFTSDEKTDRQNSAPTRQMTDNWLTCMINSVFTRVYYSSILVMKSKYADEIKQKRSYLHHKPNVILFELISAIKSNTDFSSKTGPNPVPPAWFKKLGLGLGSNSSDYMIRQFEKLVKEKCFDSSYDVTVATKKDQIIKCITSGTLLHSEFLAFITVAYALHVKKSKKQEDMSSINEFAKDDEFTKNKLTRSTALSAVARVFLEFFLPVTVKQTSKKDIVEETVVHNKPTMDEYANLKEVATSLKNAKFLSALMKETEKTDSYEKKAKLAKLHALIGELEPTLFSANYVNGLDDLHEED